MVTSDEATGEGADLEGLPGLEARYEAALVEWRAWDRRAVEAQSCDVAAAAQRSLDELRRLERRLARGLKGRLVRERSGTREPTARANRLAGSHRYLFLFTPYSACSNIYVVSDN